MHQGKIGIAPEGYPFIFLCVFSAMLFAVIGYWPAAILLLLITWISAYFFRDPERVALQQKALPSALRMAKSSKFKKLPIRLPASRAHASAFL